MPSFSLKSNLINISTSNQFYLQQSFNNYLNLFYIGGEFSHKYGTRMLC
jgi:hypothetical protein